MAGCVFWDGAGVGLGAFPGAACRSAKDVYIVTCATKLYWDCFYTLKVTAWKTGRWIKLGHTKIHAHTHSHNLKLTVLASVKGLYSSRPPGGVDRVTWVTEGSYKVRKFIQEFREGKLQLQISYIQFFHSACIETGTNYLFIRSFTRFCFSLSGFTKAYFKLD